MMVNLKGSGYRMITKLLVSAAIVLGAAVGVAAPALADPAPNPNPGINPFAGVNCASGTNCQQFSQQPDPQQLTPIMRQGFSDLQAKLAQG